MFYIPLAVLIIYRYTIQGLGHSGLAMFAGVAEMIARAMVGFWFVPLWGYFAACIASPVAWFFACFFLIPAYFVVFRKLQKEKAAGSRRKGAVRVHKKCFFFSPFHAIITSKYGFAVTGQGYKSLAGLTPHCRLRQCPQLRRAGKYKKRGESRCWI